MKNTENNTQYMGIEGHLGYAIGSDGTVWEKVGDEVREMKYYYNKDGYKYVSFHEPGYFFVHQLVFDHFSGFEVPEGYVIDHIDTDKQNNMIENLRAVPKALNSLNRDWTKGTPQISEHRDHWTLNYCMFGKHVSIFYETEEDAKKGWATLTAFKATMYEQIIESEAIYPQTLNYSAEDVALAICLDDDDEINDED